MVQLTEKEKIAIKMIRGGSSLEDIASSLTCDQKTVYHMINSAKAKEAEIEGTGVFLAKLALRDVDSVLDEVNEGKRCSGCHLIFTPRSTCTIFHCDARDDVWEKLPAIRAIMEAINNL